MLTFKSEKHWIKINMIKERFADIFPNFLPKYIKCFFHSVYVFICKERVCDTCHFMTDRHIPDRRQSETLLTIYERGSKSLEQCFRLPFVANLATNGN